MAARYLPIGMSTASAPGVRATWRRGTHGARAKEECGWRGESMSVSLDELQRGENHQLGEKIRHEQTHCSARRAQARSSTAPTSPSRSALRTFNRRRVFPNRVPESGKSQSHSDGAALISYCSMTVFVSTPALPHSNSRQSEAYVNARQSQKRPSAHTRACIFPHTSRRGCDWRQCNQPDLGSASAVRRPCSEKVSKSRRRDRKGDSGSTEFWNDFGEPSMVHCIYVALAGLLPCVQTVKAAVRCYKWWSDHIDESIFVYNLRAQWIARRDARKACQIHA